MSEKLARYLQKKQRELSAWEKAQIREHIAQKRFDVYEIARRFECVPVQVAGIKAAMTRGQ